jgi:aspartate racemase
MLHGVQALAEWFERCNLRITRHSRFRKPVPLITDPWFYLLAVPALLITGISKGGFASGGGNLAVPAMALLIPPAQAAAITLPVLCAMDLAGLRAWWGRWSGREMRAILPGGLLGILLGAFAFGFMSNNATKLMVGAIAIPCNTAHGWYEGMRDATDLPILHIVDAAAEDLARQGIRSGRIGVMGTAGTLAMRLYQPRLEALGYEVIVPEPAEMEALVSPGIALVKANKVAEAYAPLAEAAGNLRARGAAAVVLGCTEIPLGILAGPYAEIGVPLVDTIDALALSAIRWARG